MNAAPANDTATDATWEDLLVRSSTTDKGEIPAASPPPSSSPDLIPVGTMPVDPKTLIADMSSKPAKDVFLNESNYIYARGVNLAPGEQSGKIHLYYSLASLLQYPAQWSGNEIPLNDGSFGSPVQAAKGANFVTGSPFFWENVKSPGENTHYCLIGRVVTASHPNPIPEIMELEDFAKWIAGNRGMSWRNISVVTDPNASTFEQKLKWEQGETTEAVHLMLVCNKLPVGAEVAFSCGEEGPEPRIEIGRTRITNPNVQLIGLVTTIPAKFDSWITYSYWANGTKLQQESSITLEGIFVPPADSPLTALGVDLDKLRIPPDLRPDPAAGPRTGICVGSHTTVVAAD